SQAEGVDDVKARLRGTGHFQTRARASGHWKPSQPDAENELQHEAHPENGDAVDDVRVQADCKVTAGPAPAGGIHAHWDAESQAHQHAEQCELNSGGSFSMIGWLTFCLKIIESPRSSRASLPRYSTY